ncbi:MAG: pyridoxal-phosphate dependent enzyme [Candidatus Thermoplasmatota archaeon]|nr:pyridoxal-phosphate dependent enzyme [Candidatus Thermoplasmatota archaeon]
MSLSHVRRAALGGYDVLSLGTCGNYGASVAYYSRIYGKRTVVGIPSAYTACRRSEIESYGASILGLEGTYEEALGTMGDLARDNNWYDCNPGSVNSDVDLSGYQTIADEIISQLGHAPEIVSVPVGNGTTLAGIFEGFRKAYQSGTTDRIPSIIGASTSGGNPIVESWKKGYRTIRNLRADQIRETGTNEPLISYRPTNGQEALTAIYQSRGYAEYVTDEEMLYYSRFVEQAEGISALPASSSAIASAVKVLGRIGNDRECVIVLTGRGRT